MSIQSYMYCQQNIMLNNRKKEMPYQWIDICLRILAQRPMMQCMEAVFIGLEAALEAPNTHIVDALTTQSLTKNAITSPRLVPFPIHLKNYSRISYNSWDDENCYLAIVYTFLNLRHIFKAARSPSHNRKTNICAQWPTNIGAFRVCSPSF